MDIGRIIRDARLKKGLTQSELGEKVGVQKSAIAKYENGRVVNIKRSTLQGLADVLGLNPSVLVVGDENQLFKNIKKYRLEAGLSQEELAKRVGYTSQASIAKIEKGLVDLSQTKIAQFAEVFGVTPRELMGLAEEEKTLTESKELPASVRELHSLVDELTEPEAAVLLAALKASRAQK